MEVVKFLVQGSSIDPYEVTFYFDGKNMSTLCTCQAGQNGQVCKHRREILNGDTSAITSNNKADSNRVLQQFKGTPLESKLAQLIDEELQLEDLKKKLAKTKKELANIMHR